MTFQRAFVYPFSALVGQEKLKKALLLIAVNRRLEGVLLRGEKGTAKSTAVRALAALLPEIEVVEGCPYSCDPQRKESLCLFCREQAKTGAWQTTFRPVRMVELPISASEDRLVGSLDFEYAIKHGRPRFEPGLLARAHRGIIYVDEVNLLDDLLVDALLDAAASGMNVVEREGISFTHPAEFILVGTMNPEEGELRPQLLDRFGLCVQVEGTKDPAERVEILRRRKAFDDDPLRFLAYWSAEERCLKEQIISARQKLERVTVSPELLKLAAKLSLEAFVAGHRADIIMTAAARTIAAWQGRTEVKEEDIYEAAELVLFHRLRQTSPPPPQGGPRPQQEKEQEEFPENGLEEKGSQEQKKPERSADSSSSAATKGEPENQEQTDEQNRGKEEKENAPLLALLEEVVFSVGEPFQVKSITYEKDRLLHKGSGRRSRTKTSSRSGRYIRSTMERKNNDLALDATIRAAAPYQSRRLRANVAVAIESSDIREKVREKRIGNFLLFVVDASGSMGAQQRMIETKGAILSLLLDAYKKRDRIGMVAFRGNTAEVLLPPTNSVERAEKLLKDLPTGGKTPLSAALAKAYEVAKNYLYKEPNISPLLIIVTDGRANASMGSDSPLAEVRRAAEFIRREERIKTLLIDVEADDFLRFGLARELAEILGARYFKIDDLKADTLVQAVKTAEQHFN